MGVWLAVKPFVPAKSREKVAILTGPDRRSGQSDEEMTSPADLSNIVQWEAFRTDVANRHMDMRQRELAMAG